MRIGAGEAELLGGAAAFSATLPPRGTRLGDALWQLDRERRRGGPDATARLQLGQLAVGAALADDFVPESIATALRTDLSAAIAGGLPLELGLETTEELTDLPWEYLSLVPGEMLGLHPQVFFYRRVPVPGPVPVSSIPGPLRILVAIGSPEEQNEQGKLLDFEAELAHILDAVEPARKSGRPAFVRILENGTLEAIRSALLAERYHVLHLSCHAAPGFLALEDSDGNIDRVTAERLWREAIPPGRGVPLVVLAGCSTSRRAAGDEALPSLALHLLDHGAPAVVAMRASISDAYATAFAAELYRSLATFEEPLVLQAFGETRLALDRRGQDPRREWATPLLFLRDDGDIAAGRRLYDPRAAFETIAEPRTARLAAGILVRRIGDFVGRRADQRRILELLRDDETGGVLIRGLGGLGKSTLSAQLAQKLGAEGWLVVSLYGEVDPDGILEAVGKQLVGLALDRGLPENHAWRELAQKLRQRNIEPDERFELYGQRLLDQLPLLLLLDNFEDNLTPIAEGASAFKNPQLAELVAAWLERRGRSRLLLTCRYKVPLEGLAARRLHDHALGPLSPAEARKLFWRLPALDACSPEEQEKARRAVGGHPRTLEYLDALLQGGKSRFKDLELRLEGALRNSGVVDPGAWLAAKKGAFDAALGETITLAADDVLLDELVGRLKEVPLAESLLLGSSVYRLPVEETALIWQVGEPPILPRKQEPGPLPAVAAPAGFRGALAALAALGLLAPAAEQEDAPRWLVHRWTATRLAERCPAEAGEAHRRASLFWRWRCAKQSKSMEQVMLDLVEARHHHCEGGDIPEATRVTEWICSQLETWGAYRREDQLLREVLGWWPPKSEKAAAFLHQLGNVSLLRGDFTQALIWYQRSLVILEDFGNRAGMASSYHQLGVVAQELGEYDQALSWHQKSLAIKEELENRAGMANSYHQIGNVAHLRGDNKRAFESYQESFAIFEELGNRAGMAGSYHQLGKVAQERGDYDQALNWYQKSLAMKAELGNRAGMASSYGQLGIVARKRGDYDQALDWYRKSLAIDEELGNRAGMATAYSQMGVLLTERGIPAEAVPLNLQSLAIRLELQVPQVRINLHWLGRQREMLGADRFREILGEHLDPDSQAAILQMLDDAASPEGEKETD